tara:strand:- start:130 stop:459 length:330 start_codon:yes stop_codon:yes gene_type:complete
MGWVNDKGGSAVKKFKEGGKVKDYWSPEATQARVEAYKKSVQSRVKAYKKSVQSGVKDFKDITKKSLSKYKKETSRTPFQTAFRKARSEGKKEFSFNGKRYNTKLRKKK